MLEIVSTLINKHLKWKSHLIAAVPSYLKQEHFLEIDFTPLVNDHKKYERLLQSLYVDLDDGLINEAEYQEFQYHYRQKLKHVDKAINQKKHLAQELYTKLQNRYAWLEQLDALHGAEELNRLTLVTLVDRVEIGEHQELTLVFHDMKEIDILEQLSQVE